MPTIRSRSPSIGDPPEVEADRALHLRAAPPPGRHDVGREPGELRWCRARARPGALESDASICAFADSPSTATIATSARPITNALAVAAVRRGLRIALPARDRARDAGGRTHGRAEPAASGRREDGEEHHDAEEEEERAQSDHAAARPTRRRPACAREMPTRSTGIPDAEQQEPDDGAPAERLDPGLGEVPDRRHRRNPRRADRGPERGADRDHQTPPRPRARRCAAATTTSPLGMRKPRESTSDMSSRATTTPSSTPAADASAPTTPASTTTDVMTWPPGAHGAQQPELVRALGHEDREGVEDDEPTDDDAERREAEQQPGEEVDELADVLVVAAHDLLGVLHLVAGPRPTRAASAGARRRTRRDRCARTPRRAGRRRRRSPGTVGRSKARNENRPVSALAEPEHAHQVERPARVRPTARRRCRRRGTRPSRAVSMSTADLVGAASGARLRRCSVVHEQHRAPSRPPTNVTPADDTALVDRVTVAPDELCVALHEAVRRRRHRRSPRTSSMTDSGNAARGRRRRAPAPSRTTTSTSDSDCSNTRWNDASSVSVSTYVVVTNMTPSRTAVRGERQSELPRPPRPGGRPSTCASQ